MSMKHLNQRRFLEVAGLFSGVEADRTGLKQARGDLRLGLKRHFLGHAGLLATLLLLGPLLGREDLVMQKRGSIVSTTMPSHGLP